jgi:hypothetical protein
MIFPSNITEDFAPKLRHPGSGRHWRLALQAAKSQQSIHALPS